MTDVWITYIMKQNASSCKTKTIIGTIYALAFSQMSQISNNEFVYKELSDHVVLDFDNKSNQANKRSINDQVDSSCVEDTILAETTCKHTQLTY